MVREPEEFQEVDLLHHPENLVFAKQIVTLAYRVHDYLQTLENAAFLIHRGDTTLQMIKTKDFALFLLDSLVSG